MLKRTSLMLACLKRYPHNPSRMICNICGKEGTRIRRVSRTYGKSADLLIIENIPVVRATHCGKSYLTAETLHDIEGIKLHRKSSAVKRPVEVASFA
jgi:YgiT-type zinc finger domain-containing protein